MEPITLAEATKMMAAALKKAEEMKINPVVISILDARGDLIALQRMDGAMWRGVPISQGKAAASAAFNAPSGELTARWENPVMRALAMSENGRMIPWQGALPIHRADGALVGSVGVSGAKSDEDEAVAAAAIATL